MMAKMTIIAAVAADGGIGRKGDLLWHIREDLKHFKSLTSGHPVVMGRATWESLPKRPLPGRLNVVVSRNPEYQAPGAETFSTIEEAMARAAGEGDYFVIGGARLYEATMPLADVLELTEINAVAEDADTYFPKVNVEEWQLEKTEEGESDGLGFRFATYVRKKSQ